MMGYQALLFSPDEKLARVASQVFTELDFTVEPAHEPFGAVKKLMTQHYDAIVVDCDNEQNASLLFRSARNSSPNHSSLAIALVEGQAGVAKAYRIGANLVLTKPINVEQAKGTLRVARGLLRKNSDAASGSATGGTGHTIPASAAPVSAGGSSPWVRQSEAAIVPPSSHPGLSELEAQLPAFIDDALPAGLTRGLAGAFSAEFPTESPAIAASAKVEDRPIAPARAPQLRITMADEPGQPATQPAHPPVIKNEGGRAGFVKNETPRIAFTSLSTQNISSGLTSAGSAAAPAPAKEVKAPPARGNNNNTENNQVDDSAIRSHDTAPTLRVVPLLDGPSFSVLGEEEDSGESGSKKKILIAAVIAVAVVALGYFGYGSRGKSSAASPASQPVSTFQSPAEQASGKQDSEQSAPVPVPRSSPDAEPSLSARAGASAQPGASKTSAARLPDAPSPVSGSSPVTRIALDRQLGAKKPESTPLLVKSNPAQTRVEPQSQESTPPPPSPLTVASAAGASNDSALRGLMSSASPSLPKPTLATAKVSQGVSQGLLIKRVQPIYPQAALAMHAQGAVQIEATIDKEGNVTNLKVLSGDPLLTHAALEAVRQWRYKPYYLDGEPVEIQTQITVKFKAN
jgi:TonB family protein